MFPPLEMAEFKQKKINPRMKFTLMVTEEDKICTIDSQVDLFGTLKLAKRKIKLWNTSHFDIVFNPPRYMEWLEEVLVGKQPDIKQEDMVKPRTKEELIALAKKQRGPKKQIEFDEHDDL